MRNPNIGDAKERRHVYLDGSPTPIGVVIHVGPESGRAKVRRLDNNRHDVYPVERLTVADDTLPVPAAPVPDVMGAIRQAIMRADETRAALEAAGDWQALAGGLDQVRTLKRDLSLLESTIARSVAATMPDRKAEVDGLGVVERQRSLTRRWPEPERVLDAVVRSALDPDGTGEIPTDPVEVMAKIVGAVLACAPMTPSMNWRLGELRRRGIDPDAYAETTRADWSVRIHKGDNP